MTLNIGVVTCHPFLNDYWAYTQYQADICVIVAKCKQFSA